MSSSYFLFLESVQFLIDWRDYLCNAWNLLEIFPNVVVLVTKFVYTDNTDDHDRVMFFRFNALVSLLFWFKLACCLRFFSMASYLIWANEDDHTLFDNNLNDKSRNKELR